MFKKLSVGLLAIFCCQHVNADVAVGAGLSSLGLGVQGVFGVNPYINLRLAANGASLDENFEESGINYKGTVDFGRP